MPYEEQYLKDLVKNPIETLSVELKTWIDPVVPEGIAKIAKACIALRNNNGGFLLIGFDNATGQPDTTNAPEDVRTTYHADVIQGIAAKYASQAFEVEVYFIESQKDGREHPVICVSDGVRTPVAAKASLRGPGGNVVLIKDHAVYVRTLNSNKTASTSEAKYNDWENLATTCFDNREADIGRFIRRHLAGLDTNKLKLVIAELTGTSSQQGAHQELISQMLSKDAIAMKGAVPPEQPSCQERAVQTQDTGEGRFRAVVQERGLSLPEHGSWEVAFVICGEVPKHSPNSDFLNLIASSNPHFTGWPLWMDSRQFTNGNARPYVNDSAWEALIVFLDGDPSKEVDFWRVDPRGRFYHRRAIEDDTSGGQKAPAPLTTLDFTLPIWRISEAMALGIRFAKALGCRVESNTLAYRIRWTRLRGRRLGSWVDSWSYMSPQGTAYQDEVVSAVDLPIETPESALFQYVHEALKPLYEVFDGAKVPIETVEGIVDKALARGRAR